MNHRPWILIFSVALVHMALFFFDFGKKEREQAPKKSLVVHTYTPPPPKPRVAAPQQKKIPSQGVKKDLLKELKESLAKIEIAAPPKSMLTLPKTIQSLQIDHEEKEEEERDYFVLLAHSLKEALELPEYGEVKLELTVNKNGQVLKLRILHAASPKNQRYLELQLPQLRLPPFSKELKNETSHTFTLTFCNDH